MLSGKIKLTAQEILEKDFKIAMRGYKQEEVDKYLDLIIKDYEMFNRQIEELQQEIERLKRQKDELPSRQAVAQPPTGTTNFDILKRLSNLEKHVFGSKLYE